MFSALGRRFATALPVARRALITGRHTLPMKAAMTCQMRKCAMSARPLENQQRIDLSIVVTQMRQSRDTIDIVWGDGHHSAFHYIWLRDNCPCDSCHHPKAQERLLDTHSIDLDILPSSVTVSEETMEIIWPDGHETVYLLESLKRHSSTTIANQAQVHECLWDVESIQDCIPRIDYGEVMNADKGMERWFTMLRQYGFSLISNVPNDNDQSVQVARRISFLRETFWGDSWSVKSEPNPRNLSLTGVELFPHTDFSWSPTPPGMQFLHCVQFTGPPDAGGESTLVDGFRVAEELRMVDPQAFRLLSSVQLEHSFSSSEESYLYSHRGTTFQLDNVGNVRAIRYNQANRKPLDMPAELMRPMYDALKRFTQMIRSPEYLLKFRLQEGEMLVFNNHRLLHGRSAYDPQVVGRHLHGCYLDLEEFESKCSVLNRSVNTIRKQLHQSAGQRRSFSTGRQFDPGFDKYDDKFINDALKPYEDLIKSGEKYEDGSSLKKVYDQKSGDFTALKDGTKADFIYQCALFGHDVETNLVNRLVGMLEKLEGDHIRLGTGAQVDLFQHSVQCATRAYHDKADEEMVVLSLLHDIGEMMSPLNHGEIAAAILRPYISVERYWILAHHEIFQGYYYFHHVGGDRNTREIYKEHEMYQPTIDFCEKYDQPAFDPEYESLPIDFFKPMLKRTFQRTPYWFQPNHPKLGVVTIRDDDK